MKLVLQRLISTPKSTIGELSVDGIHECVTLEDALREHKIFGQTAIPIGLYPIALTWSPRFNRTLPLVQNVPGFDGIRIHLGNTAEDTAGCILVGQQADVDRILHSRLAFELLYDKLWAAWFSCHDPITLEIKGLVDKKPQSLG